MCWFFCVIPYGELIGYSLQDKPVNRQFAGLQNYIGFSANRAFWRALSNMAVLSFGGMLALIGFSLALSLLLIRQKRLNGFTCGSLHGHGLESPV